MKLTIDYALHPAFAPFVKRRNPEPREYRELFAKVDALASDVFRPDGPFRNIEERWTHFDTQTKPARKTFDSLVGGDSAIEPRLAPMVKQCFRKAVKHLALECEQSLTRLRPDFAVSKRAAETAAEIDAAGFCRFEMPKRWFDPLKEFLKDDLEKVRAKIGEGTGEILMCNPGELPHAIMRDFCQQRGVFDALSALYGTVYDKVGFALHVSHPGDRWYRVYDDLGLPVSRTMQMHYDLAYDVPKAMVYLNDISEEQGPFCLVPESHHWEDMGFWLSFRKRLGNELTEYYKQELGGKAPGPNDSPFKSAAVRQAFASLPEGLRSTAHPGEHIQDDTELSRALLSRETKITGEAGTLALFTGNKVLHRGGITTHGERWALQVCFWPAKATKLPSKAGIEQKPSAEPAVRKSFFQRMGLPIFRNKAPGAPSAAETGPPKPVPATTPPAPPAPAFSNKRFGNEMSVIAGPDNRLTLVDVGGASNLQPHWHRFHRVADFIVYEPHRGSFDELVERQKSEKYYQGFRYLQEALSGTGGTRTLYKSNAPTGSSLLPPKQGAVGNFPGNSYLYPMTEESIETVTLKDSLSKAGVARVDGIKLDTQGTELEILRGLGPQLSSRLLLVEMEISVLDHYEGGAASLESVIPCLKAIGLDIFDLRTTRFPGNAIRMKSGEVEQWLQRPLSSPSIAQRLNEVDAVFIRDPRVLIDLGTDESTVRRLIAVLCAYNFFPEAIFAASYACEKGVMTGEAREAVCGAIRNLHAEARIEVLEWEKYLEAHQGQNWGQYMWVPYPSA